VKLVKKDKKKYTYDDINKRDVDLLVQAAQMSEKYFFCFGNSWFKLYILELIDEDTRVTPLAHDFMVTWIAKQEALN
jgi:hypothetical protein